MNLLTTVARIAATAQGESRPRNAAERRMSLSNQGKSVPALACFRRAANGSQVGLVRHPPNH